MQGWIKKHRRIMLHWLYEEERVFSRYEAFDFLLMMVNHQENKTMMDGKLVSVERGQIITSVRKLCDRWKWSNTKVVQFLDALENDGMITKISDTKKTVITIDNYGKYQGSDDEETTQKRYQNDTETIQKHTNKNVKNENKKDIPHRDLFEKFYETYPRREGRVDAESAWANMLTRKGDPNDVITAAYNYMVRTSADKTEKKFMKLPASFINKDRWKEFLTPIISGNGTSIPKQQEKIITTDEDRDYMKKIIEGQRAINAAANSRTT